MRRTRENEDKTHVKEPDTGTARKQFDGRTEPPSIAVVSLVAAVAGCDPAELEPLSDVLDPDALDELFAPTPTGRHRTDGRVEFSYHGYDVTVYSYGVVEVEPTGDERPDRCG